MPDFIFSVGAAFDTGKPPKVMITFPENTALMTVDVASAFVIEVNKQIARLMPPPKPEPTKSETP